MIPIWVFIVFFAVYTAVLIWERWDYYRMKENMELLEHYLDLYVSKYGTIAGVTVEEIGEDVDANNSK